MASPKYYLISKTVIFFTILSQLVLIENVAGGNPVDIFGEEEKHPYSHSRFLDGKGKYFLEWDVDWKENRIVFGVTVQTHGYVGFGLSKKGRMAGSDMVIGGILPNGKPYFGDFHGGIEHEAPIKDASQDWSLHWAWENSSHTCLSFSRPLETCDDAHDYPIDDNSLAVIWAYGEQDNELEYHNERRGSQPLYLLDPVTVPSGVVYFQWTPNEKIADPNVNIWEISDTEVIPTKPTTYLCSIQKFTSSGKKHIFGYNPILPTEVEQTRIHHFILFRCNLPPELNPEEVFEPVLGIKDECYILQQPTGRVPTNYCQEQLYVWAVGDEAHFIPNHVGLPATETGTDYYMFQRHFDNPTLTPGIRLNYGLEIFTTSALRQYDSGVIFTGKLFPASPGIMIPPSSLGHPIHGHCGSSCTKSMIPPEGIRAYSAQLHTHSTGQSVRLIHIRNGKELEPITGDDNYFPTYQKSRLFRQEHLILPGDQMFLRCIYSNTGANNSVTVGGFHAVNEMCVGSLYYYNKIPNRGVCGSEMRSDTYRNFLQIFNTTWVNEILENVVTSPEENTGLPVSVVGNERINWTIEKRRQLLELHRYLPQITVCPPFVSGQVPMTKGNLWGVGGRGGGNAGKYGGDNILSDLYAIQRGFVGDVVSSVFKNNKHFKRSLGGGEGERNLNGFYWEDFLKEILVPGAEFVSVYGKDVIPWQGPARVCPRRQNYYDSY